MMVGDRRKRRWQALALGAMALFGLLMLVNLCRTGHALWQSRHDLADLQYEHDQLDHQRAALQSGVQFLQSPEGTEAALRKMGNVKPGEKAIRFVEPPPKPSALVDSPPWPVRLLETTRTVLHHRFGGAATD